MANWIQDQQSGYWVDVDSGAILTTNPNQSNTDEFKKKWGDDAVLVQGPDGYPFVFLPSQNITVPIESGDHTKQDIQRSTNYEWWQDLLPGAAFAAFGAMAGSGLGAAAPGAEAGTMAAIEGAGEAASPFPSTYDPGGYPYTTPNAPSFDPTSGAGEFNVDFTAPDALGDPYYDYSTYNPDSTLNQPPRIGDGPTGGPNTISNLAQWAPAAAVPFANELTSEGGSGSLPFLPNGSIDWARLAGAAIPAAVGAFAANRQANSLEDLSNRYMAMGEPSRARYEASYQPDFTMAKDPGYSDALNQTAKGTLHALSANVGNPADSPNAWNQTLTDVNAKFAYPALQDYRRLNANAGGLSRFAEAAPGASTAAIGANKGVYDALGVGARNVVDIFSPPRQRTLAEILKEAGYA